MKVRRSQKERSEGTCARLREATIALIAERGYANTTTIRISKKAGVSRGALLHHYPAKNDLIVDAAAQVWQSAIDEVRELSEALSQGTLDIEAFVEGVWSRVFPDESVTLTLDLMSAARSDEGLRDRISGHLEDLFKAYDQIADQAFANSGFSKHQQRVIVSLTTCTIRGLKLQEIMHPNPAMTQAIRDSLKVMLQQMLSSSDRQTLLPDPGLSKLPGLGKLKVGNS